VGAEGRIELAYVRVAKGDVAKTVEIAGDRLLADYDAQGSLVGIEILEPIDTLKLQAIVPADHRARCPSDIPAHFHWPRDGRPGRWSAWLGSVRK